MKKFLLIVVGVMLSLYTNAQSITSDLPKTWSYQSGIGVFLYTLNKDGSITTQMINNCFSCYGSGRCGVCGGIGARFIVDSSMICNLCHGNGICKRCGGKGYTVLNSKTQYGVTITIDEKGNVFVGNVGSGTIGGYNPSSSNGSGGSHGSRRTCIETIEYVPNFGLDNNVYCPTCNKNTSRHVHVKKYR